MASFVDAKCFLRLKANKEGIKESHIIQAAYFWNKWKEFGRGFVSDPITFI